MYAVVKTNNISIGGTEVTLFNKVEDARKFLKYDWDKVNADEAGEIDHDMSWCESDRAKLELYSNDMFIWEIVGC